MDFKSSIVLKEYGMVFNLNFLLFQQLSIDELWYLIHNNSIIARNDKLDELILWAKENINN